MDPLRHEHGFTLVELLIVCLIASMLAAIALPTFLSQQAKGQDAEAKSNARTVVSHLESCFAQEQTYAGCDAAGKDVMTSGLPVVTAAPARGEVQVTSLSANGYEVAALSKSGTTFTIEKAGGTLADPYTCSAAGKGGCGSARGGTW